MSESGGNNEDNQGGDRDNRGAGVSPSGNMRLSTSALRERGLIRQMEEKVREVGLGGWFNGMDQGLLESWSGPNSDTSKSQDQVRTTLLTTIGGHTLPNPVRVPDSVVQPRVLRPLMEGLLRPWQFLVYADGSPLPYKDNPVPLLECCAGHTLL